MGLFTRAQLTARLEDPQQPVSGLRITRFGPEDFGSPSSEESIEVHACAKTAVPDALTFWVGSLRSRTDIAPGYFDRYARAGLCRAIDAADFNRVVGRCSESLVPAVWLPPHGDFVAAMVMYDDWNDVGLLAESTGDWVAFYWNTTA